MVIHIATTLHVSVYNVILYLQTLLSWSHKITIRISCSYQQKAYHTQKNTDSTEKSNDLS